LGAVTQGGGYALPWANMHWPFRPKSCPSGTICLRPQVSSLPSPPLPSLRYAPLAAAVSLRPTASSLPPAADGQASWLTVLF
ncbi:MAG: hypothetical protein FWD31_11760, partial [Planctomycetaceae bacterium]|nr:hypothetical protein [Planctomycetaceae bacterium]